VCQQPVQRAENARVTAWADRRAERRRWPRSAPRRRPPLRRWPRRSAPASLA
jgi:hypothetical protein